MRLAGERWLPREPGESHEAYGTRIGRSVLFNGLARTVQAMAGRPFVRPVVLGEAVPEPLRTWARDIDLMGRDLTVFARDVFRAALLDGVTHVLVDYPRLPDGLTLAEERALAARPYLVHVPAADVIGWRTERAGGAERLVQLRLRECTAEPDGEWGERGVERIRVLEPGSYALYAEDQQRRWQIVEAGATSLDAIPLVTIYAERTGLLTATPPLLDLAWLNLAHWQSASDQRHILHVARVPILFGRNLRVGAGELEIGPNRMIQGEGEGADLRYVEHSGAAIAAGRDDLSDLEARMAALGADLIAGRTGGAAAVPTATQRAIEAAQHMGWQVALVRGLELGLGRALALMAEWAGLPAPMPADGLVDISDETGTSVQADADVSALIELRRLGDLDRATLFHELKRRGVLAEAAAPAVEG